MKKLVNLKEDSLDMNEMSMFNGGTSGDTAGAAGKNTVGSYCYSCDYVQPDGSGTIRFPDETRN